MHNYLQVSTVNPKRRQDETIYKHELLCNNVEKLKIFTSVKRYPNSRVALELELRT